MVRKNDNTSLLTRLLSRVRRRWHTKRVLRAAAVALGVVLLLALGAIAFMDQSRFESETVATVRLSFYALAALVFGWCCLPLVRRFTDQQAAAYVETESKDLDALILSAVEVKNNPTSTTLSQRVIEQAVNAFESRNIVASLARSELRRAGIAIGIIIAVAGILFAFGPAKLQHGAGLLLPPSAAHVASNPYAVTVTPGDVEILEGADQRLAARVTGFLPNVVNLWFRELDDKGAPQGVWITRPMDAEVGAENGSYEEFLFNLRGSLEYYVDGDDVRSPVHRITVIPRPEVTQVDLLYQFPKHTRRPAELVEGEGDIKAVRGTEVEIRASVDRPVTSGQLVIGDQRIPMTLVEGSLRASINVEHDTQYFVEVPTRSGALVTGSREYAVIALDDQLPEVDFRWPRRDIHATSVEELLIAARAGDDVALQSFELVLSVNGGAERVISLAPEQATTQSDGEYLFALEEETLVAGDLIAFYARASDADNDPTRVVTTDMFFVDVRPYERRFRAGPSGGGGGGGGQQNEPKLSAQQRSLVIALFKTQRDRLSDEIRKERLETLRTAQSRIRDRTEAIARRIGPRQVFEEDRESTQNIAEELPKASAAMVRVEALLAVQDTQQALPEARKALQHLQRAEAALRDIQVARSRSSGGGQGADDLANLFQLEMDKFRNQYEDVQRAQRESQAASLDETLRKLEEMARRQQREVERANQRAEQGSGSAQSQAELAAQVEEFIRQLERLSRKKQDKATQESLEQMRQAVQAMRDSEGKANPKAAEEALERLRNAQAKLERSAATGIAKSIGDAAERSADMAEEQRELSERIAQPRAKDERAPNANDVIQRKNELARNIRKLQNDLTRLAKEAKPDRQAIAKAIEAAAAKLRRDQIAARMELSTAHADRGPDARSETEENRLAQALEQTAADLKQTAEQAAGQSEDQMAQAQQLLRKFTQRFEADRRAAEGRRMRLARQSTGANQDEREGARSGSGERAESGAKVGAEASDRSDPQAQQSQGQQSSPRTQGRGEPRAPTANPNERGDAQSQARENNGQRGSQDGQSGEQRQAQNGQPTGQRGRSGLGPIGPGGTTREGGETQGERAGTSRADANNNIRGTLVGRLSELSEISKRFAASSDAAGEIEKIIDALGRLTSNPNLSERVLVQEHKALGEQLKALEYQLRSASQKSPALIVAKDRSALPATFRDEVERYYRDLSEQRATQ